MANVNDNEVFELVEGGDKVDLFGSDEAKQTLVDRMKRTEGLTHVLRQMAEHSEIDPNSPYVMDKVKGQYDIEGRFSEADVPSEYSFDEMNRPLGVSGTAGPEINVQDILQQQTILSMKIDKMHGTQSIFGSDYLGTAAPELNEVLNAMHKLNYMIDISLDWSQEDTDKQRNIMIDNLLDLYKKFPREFPKYENIKEFEKALRE